MVSTEGISRQGWSAVGLGLALAAVAVSLPFVRSVLSYFTVLVHEMGHAFAGWLYGYPSVPAFDFVYGGGITSRAERVPWIAGAVQAALIGLAWLFRRNKPSLLLSGALAAAYAATAWTTLHEAVITAMGHGTELIIAGVFIHRAFSGRACHHPSERTTYAFVGFFVTFDNLRFAWLLITSPLHRAVYEEAKGGGHWMDFSLLARDTLHTSVESVAAWFFVLCLLPPLLAWLGNRHGAVTAAAIARLRQVA